VFIMYWELLEYALLSPSLKLKHAKHDSLGDAKIKIHLTVACVRKCAHFVAQRGRSSSDHQHKSLPERVIKTIGSFSVSCSSDAYAWTRALVLPTGFCLLSCHGKSWRLLHLGGLRWINYFTSYVRIKLQHTF
jgi:hypothetical protein